MNLSEEERLLSVAYCEEIIKALRKCAPNKGKALELVRLKEDWKATE